MDEIQEWWDEMNPYDRRELALFYYTSDKLCREEIVYIYHKEKDGDSIIDRDHQMISNALFHLTWQ